MVFVRGFILTSLALLLKEVSVVAGRCPSIDTSASTGVIYSPQFPWNYPNGMTCTWNITVPSWKRITLNFTHFDLEGSSFSSCYNDYVEVRTRYNYYGGRKYCGTRSPFTFTRYGSVSVTFYSDSYTTRSGFLAFYQEETSYHPTTYPYYTLATTTYPYYSTTSGYHSTVYTCNSYYTTLLFLSTTSEVSLGVCREDHKLLTELSGQLSSLDDGFCTWLITLPKDLRIILYFKSYNIDVTGNNLTCGSQGTRIELKDSFEDQPWKTYCQSKMPQPVATNKSSLLVNFILSESDDKSWFTASYTTLPFEKKVDLGEVSGAEISSPMYPGRYPRNSYFKWSVVAPSGFRIKIQFTKVKMSHYSSDCRKDRVMLLDGSSEESKVLDTICGERTVQPVYTSGNSLTVEFRSAVGESDYDGNGFKATLSKEAKLYLILLPCAAGILLLFVIVVAIVFMYRRRRLTLPSASRPRMQMSLLNDDDHISTTQISAEANPANEANLPVYRPTTQAIKS